MDKLTTNLKNTKHSAISHQCNENYNFNDFSASTRASNCLTIIAIQNYQKEVSLKQFYYLGKTILSIIIAQFVNQTLQNGNKKNNH